jgi:hypothetical protein
VRQLPFWAGLFSSPPAWPVNPVYLEFFCGCKFFILMGLVHFLKKILPGIVFLYQNENLYEYEENIMREGLG